MTEKTLAYDRVDNSPREPYYGAGVQPWDQIVEGGFGASFAAGSILKYLRRTKGEWEKDIAKARWYYARMQELPADAGLRATARWLMTVLTQEELNLLEAEEVPDPAIGEKS